ncbi:MAG: TRAP transporter small permease [Aestuariivita sp.]|nr:TRAP transporter small permease [Aestuariivita sp.]MCY4202879.1 TRAP transporter small permease [Aestuariivita sp.]
MYVAIDRLARFFALLGGVVLSALIILTCLSIAGRLLHSFLHGDFLQKVLPSLSQSPLLTRLGAINGDFELVEVGMAFVIFAFLPLCQLRGSHAAVDVFSAMLPANANKVLNAIIATVFLVVLVIIAWQLFAGMQSKRNSGQTTFLLQFPIWWAYAASLSGAVVTALIAAYIALRRLSELLPARIPSTYSGESGAE